MYVPLGFGIGFDVEMVDVFAMFFIGVFFFYFMCIVYVLCVNNLYSILFYAWLLLIGRNMQQSISRAVIIANEPG